MIKLFEKFNNYNQVKDWLDDMGIDNYTINDDLTVDVNSSVMFRVCIIKEFPIKFRYIDGGFNCSLTSLTTLKGCPEKVNGNFMCSENNLSSLKYAPKEITGKMFTGNNPLPYPIKIFKDIKIIAKYQDEYGIWNNDGTLNKERWKIFVDEYEDGLLD